MGKINMLAQPELFAGASVFFEGEGFLGTVKELQLPKIEFITQTSTSGISEREINSGLLKAMTTTFTFSETNKVYFEGIRKQQLADVSFKIKQSIKTRLRNKPLVATVKGEIKLLEYPPFSLSSELEVKIELITNFYKLEEDGSERCLIDLKNMICQIAGVDQFAWVRSQLI